MKIKIKTVYVNANSLRLNSKRIGNLGGFWQHRHEWDGDNVIFPKKKKKNPTILKTPREKQSMRSLWMPLRRYWAMYCDYICFVDGLRFLSWTHRASFSCGNTNTQTGKKHNKFSNDDFSRRFDDFDVCSHMESSTPTDSSDACERKTRKSTDHFCRAH